MKLYLIACNVEAPAVHELRRIRTTTFLDGSGNSCRILTTSKKNGMFQIERDFKRFLVAWIVACETASQASEAADL